MNLLSERGENNYAGWTILSFVAAAISAWFFFAVAAWSEWTSAFSNAALTCSVLSTMGLLAVLWKIKSRRIMYAGIALFSSAILPIVFLIGFLQELVRRRG